MFKDTQEGQTHYENDGCGIAEHNQLQSEQPEEWEKEFEELHKSYFAILSLDCKKCGHNKNDHYWNGAGDINRSGYDRCKDCRCIDYDEHDDFVEIIIGYDTKYAEIKSFIRKIRKEAHQQIKQDLLAIADTGEYEDMRREIENYFATKI